MMLCRFVKRASTEEQDIGTGLLVVWGCWVGEFLWGVGTRDRYSTCKGAEAVTAWDPGYDTQTRWSYEVVLNSACAFMQICRHLDLGIQM